MSQSATRMPRRLSTLTTKGKVTGSTALSGAGDVVSWTFSSGDKSVWGADASNAAVEWWAYPKGDPSRVRSRFPAASRLVWLSEPSNLSSPA